LRWFFLQSKPSKAAIEADFAIKLGSAKSNSFSVLADFFGKGIFTEESRSDSGHPGLANKKSIEKLRIPSGTLAFDIGHGKSKPSYLTTSHPLSKPANSFFLTENLFIL